MTDPLPTEKQRLELCDMIQVAFVEIRILADQNRPQRCVFDLADAFHNISREMNGWGSFTWESFRRRLGRYQEAWRANEPGMDYVAWIERIRENP